MIVMERREQLRAMLELLGVRAWIYWMSWFLVAFLLLSIPTVFMILLLKWRYYPMSDWSLVLFFLLVYNFEVFITRQSKSILTKIVHSEDISTKLQKCAGTIKSAQITGLQEGGVSVAVHFLEVVLSAIACHCADDSKGDYIILSHAVEGLN